MRAVPATRGGSRRQSAQSPAESSWGAIVPAQRGQPGMRWAVCQSARQARQMMDATRSALAQGSRHRAQVGGKTRSPAATSIDRAHLIAIIMNPCSRAPANLYRVAQGGQVRRRSAIFARRSEIMARHCRSRRHRVRKCTAFCGRQALLLESYTGGNCRLGLWSRPRIVRS